MKPRKVFVIFSGVCLVAGFLCALLVSREPFGYMASMMYGVLLLFLIVPISIAFLIAAIVAGIKDNAVYAGALLLSCLLLPSSFLGSIMLLEVAGLAEYSKPENNEMRPIGQKAKIRNEIISSPLIHTAFEDVAPGAVRKLK